MKAFRAKVRRNGRTDSCYRCFVELTKLKKSGIPDCQLGAFPKSNKIKKSVIPDCQLGALHFPKVRANSVEKSY